MGPDRVSTGMPAGKVCKGPDGDWIWAMGQGTFADGPVAPGLRLCFNRPPDHGLVEPDATMPLADFRRNLAATHRRYDLLDRSLQPLVGRDRRPLVERRHGRRPAAAGRKCLFRVIPHGIVVALPQCVVGQIKVGPKRPRFQLCRPAEIDDTGPSVTAV